MNPTKNVVRILLLSLRHSFWLAMTIPVSKAGIKPNKLAYSNGCYPIWTKLASRKINNRASSAINPPTTLPIPANKVITVK